MKSLSYSYFFNIENFAHKDLFEECEFVWDSLKKIQEYLNAYPFEKTEVKVPDHVYLVNPHLISIGEGTTIEPGAFIQGPCIIGKRCQIRHGAYIRGGVILGDECVVGHASEIKNSILLNKAHAAHFNYVGDSILGSGVNLGAGTKLANLRLDKKNIFVSFDGKRIDTGLKKFGAIIGDNSQTGCNSVTNPGTLIPQDVCCPSSLNIRGFYSPTS